MLPKFLRNLLQRPGVSVRVAEAGKQDAAPYATTGVLTSNAEEEVLFGFATSGLGWDYTLGDSWETCVPSLGCVTAASARVGFALDWEIGMSLPVAIEQTAASPEEAIGYSVQALRILEEIRSPDAE